MQKHKGSENEEQSTVKRREEKQQSGREVGVFEQERVGPPIRKQEGRGRRRRADYGSVRVSERDLVLLGLIGEQYAVTLPQLARVIERRLHTARSLRDRWKRAGWVDSGQLSTMAPSFVWLTGRGASGSPFRLWQPNHGLALHIEAVTNVRLLLERDLRLGEWECERQVAQDFARDRGRRGHLPDAVLHTSEGRTAVEVELTLKSRLRLTAIIEELSLDYEQVWYFVPQRLAPTLTELAAAAPCGNVSVYRYPPPPAEIATSAR